MVYCYKYVWKKVNGDMCVRYITGPVEEHENFKKLLIESDEVELALCEYQYEIDFAKINQNEEIKLLKNALRMEENKNEEV